MPAAVSTVTVGAVYRSAVPGLHEHRIQITEVSATSAVAVDSRTGQPVTGRIPLAKLHDSNHLDSGRKRRAGWVLVFRGDGSVA